MLRRVSFWLSAFMLVASIAAWGLSYAQLGHTSSEPHGVLIDHGAHGVFIWKGALIYAHHVQFDFCDGTSTGPGLHRQQFPGVAWTTWRLPLSHVQSNFWQRIDALGLGGQSLTLEALKELDVCRLDRVRLSDAELYDVAMLIERDKRDTVTIGGISGDQLYVAEGSGLRWPPSGFIVGIRFWLLVALFGLTTCLPLLIRGYRRFNVKSRRKRRGLCLRCG